MHRKKVVAIHLAFSKKNVVNLILHRNIYDEATLVQCAPYLIFKMFSLTNPSPTLIILLPTLIVNIKSPCCRFFSVYKIFPLTKVFFPGTLRDNGSWEGGQRGKKPGCGKKTGPWKERSAVERNQA